MYDWIMAQLGIQTAANTVANQAVGQAVGGAVQTYTPMILVGGAAFLLLVFLAAHGGRR